MIQSLVNIYNYIKEQTIHLRSVAFIDFKWIIYATTTKTFYIEKQKR